MIKQPARKKMKIYRQLFSTRRLNERAAIFSLFLSAAGGEIIPLKCQSLEARIRPCAPARTGLTFHRPDTSTK